jgi:hypothetical protein
MLLVVLDGPELRLRRQRLVTVSGTACRMEV